MLAFERIKKICDDLKNLEYQDLYVPQHLMRLDGNYNTCSKELLNNDSFESAENGEVWTGDLYYGFFKFSFTLPPSFSDDDFVLLFDLSLNKEKPEAPQIKVYVDGELVQGVDSNHLEVNIKTNSNKEHVYNIGIHFYGGRLGKIHKLYVKACSINSDIRALRYDVMVPLGVAYQLGIKDYDATKIIGVLNEAIDLIDFRKTYSDSFYQSIKHASRFMQTKFYDELCSKDDKPVVSCVGSTHIDVAWKWTLGETEDKIDRSFSTVLELMRQYPEYIFMSSQPVLYEYYKKNCPEKYELLKQKVRDGVWETEGGMYLEADTNVTSGESLIRQLVYGLKFYKDEFGVDNNVLWLPDVFGYCSSLPQILIKSGIKYFMTTKISWNQFNKIPHDTFMWQGIDGTEILTHFIATQDNDCSEDDFRTTYNGFFTPSHIMGTWKRYSDKDLNNNVLTAFGFGDGGGGPTWEMLETQKRMAHGIPGAPVTQIETINSFFDRLDSDVSQNKALSKWVGELYLEYHRGTYTSMARNKKYNRKCENLLMDVELLLCIAGDKGYKNQLDDCWKLVLLNQFHDILPGSSIKEVYDESKEQYEQVLGTLGDIKDTLISKISQNISANQKSLVVFNTLSFVRDDVMEFSLDGNDNICLVDNDTNTKYPVQNIGDNKAVAYLKNIPSKGYKLFAIRDCNDNTDNSLVVEQDHLENKYFKIKVNEFGEFSSFYDKINHREVVKGKGTLNRIVAYQDKPARHNNWNIDPFYKNVSFDTRDKVDIEVLETGHVRGVLRVTKHFNKSTIIQDICIYADIDRVDFKTTIDYKEDEIMLKAHFPVDVHASTASYDIQFGSVERPTHNNTSWDRAMYEVCAHKWMDLSEHGYGVSILNDSRYGCDIHGNTMSLTLVKSGIYPNPEADRETHKLVYSIYPHKGTYRMANTVKQSYYLNLNTYTKVLEPQDRSNTNGFTFAQGDSDNVIIETVKYAEENSDIILRVYEAIGATTDATITFSECWDGIYECMMTEQIVNCIAENTDSIKLRFKPYEIKTLRLKKCR